MKIIMCTLYIYEGKTREHTQKKGILPQEIHWTNNLYGD